MIIDERYELAKYRIRQIAAKAEVHGDFEQYFEELALYGVVLIEGMDIVRDADVSELKKLNRGVHGVLEADNYGQSYLNPDYAAHHFGDRMGHLLSFLFAELYAQYVSVYEQDVEALLIRLELILEVYQSFCWAWQDSEGVPEAESIREILYSFIMDYMYEGTERRVRCQLDASENFALRIIMESDLFCTDYLYSYGEYVTDTELRTARFLAGLPEEKIARMADTFTEGYRTGFVVGGKDLSIKDTVNIRYNLGFERVIKKAVENFRNMGLEPVIYRAGSSIFNKSGVRRIGYTGSVPNRQFLYDHKEDAALFLDKGYAARKTETLRQAYEQYRQMAAVHAGPAVMEVFGEDPFSPKQGLRVPAYDAKQQKLSVKLQTEAGTIVNEYIKGDERSFTIIAFPVPDIGEPFEEIFDAVIDINTLDYTLYQGIQQKLIDTLDKADYVEIRGSGANRTDLRVKLIDIGHPDRETKFENCVADVNIPVGEVFTTPVLEGTEGVLHVSEVYLEGLKYNNLRLVFKDGFVKEYSCDGFEKASEAKKYIRDNVLFHHETLPMGEFAIGTNTLAYVIARRYNIGARLPILIAEKTGPHFAVGDTCYSHSEDIEVRNPDGKYIMAKDNSCSVLRKEDVSRAYFNCHTDITIPYDEIACITAVTAEGSRHDIIKDGRFVLEGCGELNRAFEG